MKAKRYFIALVSLVVVACALWIYGHLEAYCHFYPAIDTRFALHYSEAAFSKIHTGMGDDEVRKLIGEPLSVATNQAGVQTLWFSADGKCRWGDFAWLGRSVSISNRVVVSVERMIYYD